MNDLTSKTVEEAVEALVTKYAEAQKAKQAKQAAFNLSPEAKSALIGGLAGAGIGGLGSLGYNYLKNKRLRLSDALYGALAGAIPGASGGYVYETLFGRGPAAGETAASSSDKKDSPKADSGVGAAPADTTTNERAKANEKAKAEDEAAKTTARRLAFASGVGGTALVASSKPGKAIIGPVADLASSTANLLTPKSVRYLDPSTAPDIKRLEREIKTIQSTKPEKYSTPTTKDLLANLANKDMKEFHEPIKRTIANEQAKRISELRTDLEKYKGMSSPDKATLFGSKYMPTQNTVGKLKRTGKATGVLGGLGTGGLLADWFLRTKTDLLNTPKQ